MRKPLSQSAWFWLYVFCTSGLIGLILVGPKFERRQLAEEIRFDARQRGLEQSAGREPQTSVSSSDSSRFSLRPLYYLLGTGFAVTWFGLWWTRFRQPGAKTDQPSGEAS